MAPSEQRDTVTDNEQGMHSQPSTTSLATKRTVEAAFGADDTATTLTLPGSHKQGNSSTLVTPRRRSLRVVTPAQASDIVNGAVRDYGVLPVRRALLSSPVAVASLPQEEEAEERREEPKSKKRLIFGRLVVDTPCQPNVQEVYKLIGRLTGSVGGNGSFGAIYGELTIGSMQKMIDLMKAYAEFGQSSRFIDVGSGLGKPNLHVCQNPRVEFSYGIEMELSRWMLGVTNLQAVIKATVAQQASGKAIADQERLGCNCYFEHGNIMEGSTFDPFTHVYMFSIGFPPTLWHHLADMFNKSSSALYLICYHSPSDIIITYGFDVKLIKQAPTSMHGSKEGHMGYIYKRTKVWKQRASRNPQPCDPLFQDAWDAVNSGVVVLDKTIEDKMQETCYGRRLTRSLGVKHTL